MLSLNKWMAISVYFPLHSSLSSLCGSYVVKLHGLDVPSSPVAEADRDGWYLDANHAQKCLSEVLERCSWSDSEVQPRLPVQREDGCDCERLWQLYITSFRSHTTTDSGGLFFV